MRQHPIPPVTEPLQYRAIGVVRGVYEPSDPTVLTRGAIRTADGQAIEAVVLGRLLTLMRRHLDLSLPHLWVVYPRSREEGQLHLQMVGVWEPSTLAQAAEESAATDGLVSLDLRRHEQALQLERLEVLSPIAQRGNRGGKGRRPDAGSRSPEGSLRKDDASSKAGRNSDNRNPTARTADPQERSLDPRAAAGSRSHSRAVSRPPR